MSGTIAAQTERNDGYAWQMLAKVTGGAGGVLYGNGSRRVQSVQGSEGRKDQAAQAGDKGANSNSMNCGDGNIDKINALREQGILPDAAGPNDAARKVNGAITGTTEMAREGGQAAKDYATDHPVEAASWFVPSGWLAKAAGVFKSGGVFLFRVDKAADGAAAIRGAEAGFGVNFGSKNAQSMWAKTASREIAAGHAFEKHVLSGEFSGLGIRTREQFARHIEGVINNPSSVRYYKDGRIVFLQESTATVVFRNPSAEGTAFRPATRKAWDAYVSTLPSRVQFY